MLCPMNDLMSYGRLWLGCLVGIRGVDDGIFGVLQLCITVVVVRGSPCL